MLQDECENLIRPQSKSGQSTVKQSQNIAKKEKKKKYKKKTIQKQTNISIKMFQITGVKAFLVKLLMLLTVWPNQYESLIITSVIAGNKKFKTVSFDHKWLKPLTFEKDLPFPTEFRRHRTLRPPKFDIDVNIPIKLPLEDEYPQEEYKKPVESNLFFQTDEIHEPGYGKKKSHYNHNDKQANVYKDAEYASSSSDSKQVLEPKAPTSLMEQGFKLLPMLAKSIKFQPNIVSSQERQSSNARSDTKEPSIQQHQQQQRPQQQVMMGQESAYGRGQYAQPNNYKQDNYQQDFVPGGFVNLQLSGPTGGPKMTHEDYDRERWAQQLSQTEAAMPVPILNYHQLQNFYGGLGTFTNGLADSRYVEHSLLDKLKSGLTHFTDKLHFG